VAGAALRSTGGILCALRPLQVLSLRTHGLGLGAALGDRLGRASLLLGLLLLLLLLLLGSAGLLGLRRGGSLRTGIGRDAVGLLIAFLFAHFDFGKHAI